MSNLILYFVYLIFCIWSYFTSNNVNKNIKVCKVFLKKILEFELYKKNSSFGLTISL